MPRGRQCQSASRWSSTERWCRAAGAVGIVAIEALRENENDRASRRTAYVQAGIMTVDEARGTGARAGGGGLGVRVGCQ